MEATMTSHLPAGNGAISDMTQHITGRYLGPCTQQAEAITATPPVTMPASGSSGWVEPAARSDRAMPPSPEGTAAAQSGASAAPEEPAPRPLRARRHGRRHYPRY